jgi:glycosyltransferase involved in cell wall biosynthesis
MISVFIPAYNAHEFIDNAIMSLAIQTAKDFMKVIIINDGSEKDYQETVDKFSPYIHIEEFKHEKNMGVGYARQTALNILDTKYFAFLDADDMYIDSTAFEFFYAQMESNDNYVAIFGQFYEEIGKYSYKLQDLVDVWVFAKIYRSSFIKKNNLVFPQTRGNEDNIFNISIGGALKNNEVVINYEKPIYLWRYSKNSITRKDNFEHWFNGDLKGLINGIYYIKENPNINKQHLYNHIKISFFHLYFRYHDNLVYRPEQNFAKDILELSKKIYDDFLKNDQEWLKTENIEMLFRTVALDFQKPYENVDLFREFVRMVQ